MENLIKICRQCGKRYIAKRNTSKFDTTNCRVAYNRDMKGRTLIITQNKEDEKTMLEWFNDSKKCIVRKYTKTDTKFIIDFDYYEKLILLGEKMPDSQKLNNKTPQIIKDVELLRNKLNKLIPLVKPKKC